ncbi:uncharacterized protein LOC143248903 isoform X2 [Tachypleus tridentatus]|uniref:uncharacterized protein LOC143248903 isoform X2 n=1 Tax=Tachypleus tridentatus TaxID=6853 RepID=UPI003FD109D2
MSSRDFYYGRPRGRGRNRPPRARGFYARGRGRGKEHYKSHGYEDKYYKQSKERYQSSRRRRDRKHSYSRSRSRSRSRSHSRDSHSHYSHKRSRSRSYSRSPSHHRSYSPQSSHGRSHSPSYNRSRSSPRHQSRSPSLSNRHSHSPPYRQNYSPPSPSKSKRSMEKEVDHIPEHPPRSRLQSSPEERKYQEPSVKSARNIEEENTDIKRTHAQSIESSEMTLIWKDDNECRIKEMESMKIRPLKTVKDMPIFSDDELDCSEKQKNNNRYELESGKENDIRTQLLERAMMEKRKLGLDNFGSTDKSSALEALQCYSRDHSPHTEKEEEVKSLKKILCREILEDSKSYLSQEKFYQEPDIFGRKQESSVLQPISSSKPLKSILKVRKTDEYSESCGPDTVIKSAPKKEESFSFLQIPGLGFDDVEDVEEFLYGDSENTSKRSIHASLKSSCPRVGENFDNITKSKSSGWSDEEDNFHNSDKRGMYIRNRTPSPVEGDEKCKTVFSNRKLQSEFEESSRPETQKSSSSYRSASVDDDLIIDLQLPKDNCNFSRIKSPNKEKSSFKELPEKQAYGMWETSERECEISHYSPSRYSRSMENFHSPPLYSSIQRCKIDDIRENKHLKVESDIHQYSSFRSKDSSLKYQSVREYENRKQTDKTSSLSTLYEDLSKEKLRALKEELAHLKSLESKSGSYEQHNYLRKIEKYSPDNSKQIIRLAKKLSPSLDYAPQKNSLERKQLSPDYNVDKTISLDKGEHSSSYDAGDKIFLERRDLNPSYDPSRKILLEEREFSPYRDDRKTSRERVENSPGYDVVRKMSNEGREVSPANGIGRKTSVERKKVSPDYDASLKSFIERRELSPSYDIDRKTLLERRKLSPSYDACRKKLIERREHSPCYDVSRKTSVKKREYSPDYDNGRKPSLERRECSPDYREFSQTSGFEFQGRKLNERERYSLESLKRSPLSGRYKVNEESLRSDSIEKFCRSLEKKAKSSRKYSLEERSSLSPRRNSLDRRHGSRYSYEDTPQHKYSFEKSPERDYMERRRKSPRRSPDISPRREHWNHSPKHLSPSLKRSPENKVCYDSGKPVTMDSDKIDTEACECYGINQSVQNSSFFDCGLSTHPDLNAILQRQPDFGHPVPPTTYPPPTFQESIGPPTSCHMPQDQMFPPPFTSFPPPGYQHLSYSMPPVIPMYSQPIVLPSLSVPPPSLPSQFTQCPPRSNLRVIPLDSNIQSNPVVYAPKPEIKVEPDQKFVNLTEKEMKELVDKKRELRKQLNLLMAEVERLRKTQGEMMRKKQREKDGHKDPLLLENSKLQDEIGKQITDLKKIVEETEKKIKFGMRPFYLQEAESVCQEFKKAEENIEEIMRFEYFDPGSHWCKLCNEVNFTLPQVFDHLHSNKHKQKMDALDRPWASENKKKRPLEKPNVQKIIIPLKGVQFIYPISGFYCSLCKEFMGDGACADEHLKSQEHNRNYTKFTLLNPSYERQWNLDKSTSTVQQEKKRQKEEEKEQLAKRRKQEKEAEKRTKAVKEIEKRNKAEKEKNKEVSELEEDFVTPSTKKPPTPTEEAQEKLKSKGIKLTLLGDKSKSETQKKDVESKRDMKPQVVIIGKAPNYKSMLATSKVEDTKISGFGKFNWKKNEQEEPKDEAKLEPCVGGEKISLRLGGKTLAPNPSSQLLKSGIQLFPLRKGNTSLGARDQGNTSPVLSEDDIAKAFAGQFQSGDASKVSQDPSQEKKV